MFTIHALNHYLKNQNFYNFLLIMLSNKIEDKNNINKK
jgi:hypothetical protein